MESDSFFEARTCFEDGLKLCSGRGTGDAELETAFIERIDAANRKLAERNIDEAESAYSRGDAAKAIDHLELVKTLTYDPVLREQAELFLRTISSADEKKEAHEERLTASSCASCAGSAAGSHDDGIPYDNSLPLLEYYELLIQQLPSDQHHRYAELGEEFANAYIAASRDEHYEALSTLEKCVGTLPNDIYWYEKGKILHRLGDNVGAEQQLRLAVEHNESNSLAWFTLALVLRENNRFQDAVTVTEEMVTRHVLPEQALLIRADIFEATGEHESAINLYVELLQSPLARAAAEKLHGVLLECGRHNDAAVIFKKYLQKSCH
jgi:tetratricopeptide (TPR) repeat protein